MSKQFPTQEQQPAKPTQVSQPSNGKETAVLPLIPSLHHTNTHPRPLTSANARTLQRTIGNQALGRLTIQRKMTLGPVGDKYEQEADAIAKQVVGRLHSSSTQTTPAKTAQRQEEEEELQMKPLPAISTIQRQEEEELQAKGDPMLTGGELSSDVESSVQSAKSGGQPISDHIRGPLEQAFNADFSNVKIHADSQADTLNRSLSARAFTSGQDVFFRSGEYNPSNNSGQELLAHELTHVVQQNGGAVQRHVDLDGNKGELSSIQRKKGQNHNFAQIGNFSNGSPVIQRTIDQDARLWAMDWLATWTRAFPQAVKKYNLPNLYGICTGVLGEENPLVPAPVSQVDRATYTTALATGLVKMGAEKAGQLSARLGDNKSGLLELLQELNAEIPDEIPGLKVATPQTQLDFQALDLPDPFLVLTSGGAQFTFSQAMALHMMRRHHPKYLSGPPMQVQSYFDEDTTIKGIEAIIKGTINISQNEIKEWRKFRALKTTDLNSDRAKTLNLRPVWDGKYWELTLTLDSTNRQESKGVVAHFTPTL